MQPDCVSCDELPGAGPARAALASLRGQGGGERGSGAGWRGLGAGREGLSGVPFSSSFSSF